MFRSQLFSRHLFFAEFNLLFFFVSWIFTSNIQAAALGLPEFTAKFGFGTKISQVYVNDSQGHTAKVFAPQSTSIYVTDTLTKNSHYLAEAYIASYAFKAEGLRVGEIANQNGMRFSVQTNVRMNKYIAPWLGLGGDISYINFRKRHTIDDEGYLLDQYSDKSIPAVGFLVNVMEKWSVNPSFDIAAKLEYSVPITQTVNGLSGSIIFLFRPVL